MTGAGIPEKLRLFLFEHVDSVELIEVLLYLREQVGHLKTPNEISQELRSNPKSVMNRLEKLLSVGLVHGSETRSGAFEYRPVTADLDEIVAILEKEYRLKKHRVLELVFSPTKRARPFADAFRVVKVKGRKGGKNG